MTDITSPDTIHFLALDDLHESPFNPRKIYDEESLRELAVDIRVHGRVLQPLLVRPRIGPLFGNDIEATAGYEVVFGHRRLRASRMANMIDVPCMVRAMSDDEVKHAQISENLARKDVHPIEEAEGFQALMAAPSQVTADDIATQFGKSRSYVYGRLKLLQAIPSIRAACLRKEIDVEVALLIARLRTPEYQNKALGYINAEYRANIEDGGKASYRSIRTLLSEKFTLHLKDAIFDVNDEMLVPAAGYCGRCPKRTGNAPEFADIAEPTGDKSYGGSIGGIKIHGADVCTDPDCFAEKKKAHLKREAEKLEAEGRTVYHGAKARAAIDAYGKVKGAFVSVPDARAALKAAGKKAMELKITSIQDPRTGQIHQAVALADMKAAGAELKRPAASTGSSSRDWEAERALRAQQNQQETKVREAILSRVRGAAATRSRNAGDLSLIAMCMLSNLGGYYMDAQRVLIAELWGVKSIEALITEVATMPADDIGRLMLDVALTTNVRLDAYEPIEPAVFLDGAAANYGIDVDQVRAELAPPDLPLPNAARAAKGKAENAAAGAGAKPAKTKVKRAAVKSKTDSVGDQSVEAGSAGVRGEPLSDSATGELFGEAQHV